jgi:hypothetical protein
MNNRFTRRDPAKEVVDMALLVPRSLDNAGAFSTSPQPQHQEIKIDRLLKNGLIVQPHRFT